MDTKELELPETVFMRNIENRVFQGIVIQTLGNIDGVSLVEGNFIDNILGRDGYEGVRGIHVEQDVKNHSVSIRIDVNIGYGISIPEKSEEVQTQVTEEITRLTGLHVSSIHVVFKNIVATDHLSKVGGYQAPVIVGSEPDEDYNDEF